MLITELDKTGTFRILERAKLDKIKEELLRRNDSFFDKSTLPPIGKLVGAEYLIAGALTDFDPAISGANLKVKLPALASIESAVTYSFVRIELRLLSIETGEVVKTSTATATVKNITGGGGASFGGMEIGSSAFKKTPMGDAFHIALEKASKQLKDWLSKGGHPKKK